MNETPELRELAKRLGNPLTADDSSDAVGAATVVRHRERDTADDRSPRATLDRKLQAAREAAGDRGEP
jgi:hypothetical protein